MPEKHELPARIFGDRNDRVDPQLLITKRVLSPRDTFVCSEQDVIGWFFVVDDQNDRPGVAKLPKMGIFVNFLPSETTIAGKEGVTLGVRSEHFAHVADRHDDTYDARAAICCPCVPTLCEPMYMKGTTL